MLLAVRENRTIGTLEEVEEEEKEEENGGVPRK